MSLSPTSTGIGQPVRRREDLRLLTGRGRYSDDINVPGQAYAVMVRSAHAHARVRAIDTSPAAAVPGVLAVLTGRDMLADGLRPIPHAVRTGHPADIQLANADGTDMFIPPHHPMAIDEVRHVGDIVAMVIAGDRSTAMDAAELVAVDYAELAAVVHSRQAVAPDASLTWSDAASNLCLDATVGDKAATDAAFAAAAHVVRFGTSVQRIAGVTMEPRAAVGEYDAATGAYTLHAGAGGAVRPRHDMAVVLGVSDDDVRVVMYDVGGNFGTRGASNPEFALVCWAAWRAGRPVKWTCTRSEAFLCDYQARDLTADAELALDAQGTFLALRGTNIVNSGAYPVSFGPLHKGVEIMTSIYHVPVVHFRACATLTNTAPTRPYRSSGRPEAMFVMERLIDLAARQCGFDRIELRRRNLVPEAAMPYRNPFGLEYDSGHYHAVMDRVLTLGEWSGIGARRAEAMRRGRLRGIGIANYVDTATGVPRERAEITVQPEGLVEVVIGTVSSGQGHETSFAQLVSEWLGVPLECVVLVQGDTARVSVGGGSHSGRALRLGSIVMLGASNEIIAKGTCIAGHMLEVAAEDIEFSAGRFIVKGTDRAIGIFEVAAAAVQRNDLPDDLRSLDGIGDETVNLPAFPYGCHVCEVEVDPDTGVARIVRYAAVDDVGRAVNPMIVHGQVHGGITHGIGQALLEQVCYDRETGQLLSGSLMDYAIAHADEVPSFTTELSEVPSPTHPLGIRPAGEGGTTPALGAVVNAIVDALAEFGVTHIEMPATPERVWRAIHAIRQEDAMQTWYHCENTYPFVPQDVLDAADSVRGSLPNRHCDPKIAADLFHECLDEHLLCDDLGVNIVSIEHHAGINSLYGASPMILGTIARQTSKVRILSQGTLITVRRDPVRIAEEYATADVISRGRLEIGFVKSGDSEMVSGNANPIGIVERFWEAIDLIVKTLTSHDGPFSWEGKHFTHRHVNIWPPCWQRPHPPLWAATGDPATSAELGRRGMVNALVLRGMEGTKRAWAAYRQARVEAGLPPPALDRFAYTAFVYVADTDEEGVRVGGKLLWFLNASLKQSPQMSKFLPGRMPPEMAPQAWRSGPAAAARPADALRSMTAEQAIASRLMFAGRPETVYRQIMECYRELGGFGHLIFIGRSGFLTHAEAEKSLRLFGTEVLPRLNELAPAVAA